MKYFYLFIFSFLLTSTINAQDFVSIGRNNFSIHPQEKNLNYYSQFKRTHDFVFLSDSPRTKRKHNMYGNLTDDDTLYNRKYPIWIPTIEVIGVNGLIWSIDRYVFNFDYSHIGPESWKYNMKTGWEWDSDKFGINFIGHPYSGSLYYKAARSNGYSFFESVPFAIGGSLMWEYFGETSRPSYNDIINTPVSGVFLGEILYRLSTNVLDDQSRGAERVVREVTAGLLCPTGALNRLTNGKMFRVTHKEVYQKEPCNISLFAGIHKVNTNKEFFTGQVNEILNLQIDYGNPFEKIKRKPFDVFKIRMDLSYGAGRKLLNHVSGFGNLFTRNRKMGKLDLLTGGFQYYDYWDNETFELGTIGFGEGIISRLNIHKESNLYTSLHLAVVPFAGSSTRFGPDSTLFRDYNFGGGLQGKLESTINLGNAATATFIAYYFWIHTYVGFPGDNFVGILKPRITVTLIKNLSIGIEEYIYINDRYAPNRTSIHQTQTEQKIFLLLYLENKKRSGHYN